MAEDGVYTDWQANARGVDLNHNYSYGFGEYKKIEFEREIAPGKTLFSGAYPESEPETKALANLVRSLDFSLVVSLHSQGEEIYYFPKNDKAKRIAKSAENTLGYKISTPTDTACYGGFCDYTGCELGIPSLTLEIGRGKNPLPPSEYHRIKERLSKLLFLLPTEL
jgi:g-D-glutamyl-meso-diaminopimelate peptidase